MKQRAKYLILPIITLILEILPYGVVLNFARPSQDGEIGYFKEYYSYFDLMPYGYGNFLPFLTACLTCVIVGLLVLYCVKGDLGKVIAIKAVLGLATFFSIFPMVIMGIGYITLVGILVTLTLIAEMLLMQFTIKIKAKEEN